MNKKRFKYSVIVAMTSEGVIGYNNELIWKCEIDLKYFKTRTIGGVIIMGRNTYESIGKDLPGRVNIVITSKGSSIPKDFKGMVVKDVETALNIANSFKDKETFIIGGGVLYNSTIDKASKVYVTTICRRDGKCISGDTRFPKEKLINFTKIDSYYYDYDPIYHVNFDTYIR